MDNSTQQADEIEAIESIYGKEWKQEVDSNLSYSIEISQEVKLFVTLNLNYPSESPPTYQLLAPCLNKQQKQRISNTFQEIYLDNIGEPVLFQWIEKLKDIVSGNLNENSVFNNTAVGELPTGTIHEDSISQKADINVVHGSIIQDRKSTFQGHVCKVNSIEDVQKAMEYLMENKKIAQATHNISAFRIDQIGGAILQDCNNDGESYAGGRLLHLLQVLDVKNVLVVVSRWYGGTHLGPDRFRHINNAARQVLQEASFIQ